MAFGASLFDAPLGRAPRQVRDRQTREAPLRPLALLKETRSPAIAASRHTPEQHTPLAGTPTSMPAASPRRCPAGRLVQGVYGEGDLASWTSAALTGSAAFQQCVRLGEVVQRQHGAGHRSEFAPVDQVAEGRELRPAGARRTPPASWRRCATCSRSGPAGQSSSAVASTSTRTSGSKRYSTPMSEAGGSGSGSPTSPATASTPAMNASISPGCQRVT